MNTNDDDAKPISRVPRVFISYTHETPEHKRWVAELARRLRENGADVVLDQWDLGFGDDATLFMEREIKLASRVLLICTPTYCRKANEGEGGVGYERMVVTSEIAERIETNKFICVLRSGRKKDAIPTFGRVACPIRVEAGMSVCHGRPGPCGSGYTPSSTHELQVSSGKTRPQGRHVPITGAFTSPTRQRGKRPCASGGLSLADASGY